VTTKVCDFNTGLVTSATDVNNVTTILEYNDALNRPTRTVRAYGTSVQSQSTIAYDDVNRIITTTSDQNNYNDNLLRSQIVYDGLGRTIESRQYEGGTNYITAQTKYDALGRAFKTSNPFRPWNGETAVWTTSAFDALGRVVTITTPDSAIVTTSYSGNTVTVTDQTGKQRKSVSDALGRLIQVYEAPNDSNYNYLTSYSYDSLDDLITVTQGSQTRTFGYDSSKRLTSAMNPESGLINYQYDANGNLQVKTDARGVSSHISYDALNRNTRRCYNESS
jgi:YD repeat-containing protein